MKWIFSLVAVILIFSGGVFFLQGIRLLPSPVMYGRPEWVVIGATMFVGGSILAAFINRQNIRKLFRTR